MECNKFRNDAARVAKRCSMNATQTLHKYCTNVAQTLHQRCKDVAQTLHKRYILWQVLNGESD